jgi:hypothetical protein
VCSSPRRQRYWLRVSVVEDGTTPPSISPSNRAVGTWTPEAMHSALDLRCDGAAGRPRRRRTSSFGVPWSRSSLIGCRYPSASRGREMRRAVVPRRLPFESPPSVAWADSCEVAAGARDFQVPPSHPHESFWSVVVSILMEAREPIGPRSRIAEERQGNEHGGSDTDLLGG